MTARDELALELFVGDNGNQSRGQSIVDWEWFKETYRFRGRIEHYHVMADAVLAAGYRRPRTISTVEELDALPEGAVVMDSAGDVSQLRGGVWCGYETNPMAPSRLAKYLPATVLYEPQPTEPAPTEEREQEVGR